MVSFQDGLSSTVNTLLLVAMAMRINKKFNFLSLGNLCSHLNIRYILDGGINLICKGLQLNPLIY